MANIIKGFNLMSDAQIADQIALLRSMTMWNSFSPTLAKAGRGAVRAVNFFRDLAGKDKYKEPVVKDLPAIIMEERARWDSKSRSELDCALRQELANRTGTTLPASDTALSVSIIAEAARGLGIDDGMSPAHEAFAVTVRFQERLQRDVQKRLSSLSEAERRTTDQELGQQISKMSVEQREEIRKLLKVERLTGEAVRNALTKASAPSVVISVINMSGFGAYMALSKIIHANLPG